MAAIRPTFGAYFAEVVIYLNSYCLHEEDFAARYLQSLEHADSGSSRIQLRSAGVSHFLEPSCSQSLPYWQSLFISSARLNAKNFAFN